MLKGQGPTVASMFMVAFVLGFGMLLFYLVIPHVGRPALETYSKEAAFLNAQVLASNINAMSTVDKGNLNVIMRGAWDILITEEDGVKKLVLQREDEENNIITRSSAVKEVIILGNVEIPEELLFEVMAVKINKDEDGFVRLYKI